MHHNDAPSRALFGMARNTLHYKVTKSQSERVTGPAIENIDFVVIKMVQKSTENRPNIDPKSTNITTGAKNVAHFVLGAVLEVSWARLRDQESSKLASQIEEKSIKNPSKIDPKFDAF